jgi:ketosteroid isomerase-like protein
MTVDVVTSLYDARARGDVQAVRTLLDPDVVWREPGDASYSGVAGGSMP